METETFSSTRIGTTGHEICDPDGQVIGWTVTEYWAAAVVALLNGAGDSDASHRGMLPSQGNFRRKLPSARR